jgi:hypothetical protein
MNLNPTLSRTDRIGSLVIGAGLLAYALSGDLNQVWVRVVLIAFGLAFTAGGIGGT